MMQYINDMVIRATLWYNITIVSLTNVLTLSAGNECNILMDH